MIYLFLSDVDRPVHDDPGDRLLTSRLGQGSLVRDEPRRNAVAAVIVSPLILCLALIPVLILTLILSPISYLVVVLGAGKALPLVVAVIPR